MSDLWTLERRLWTGGIEAYQEVMATNCTMVFGPVGILQRQEVIESLRQAPRWSDVKILEASEIAPTEGVVILAYYARAQRDDGDEYGAICTSTYVRQDSAWRIAQHQQTRV